MNYIYWCILSFCGLALVQSTASAQNKSLDVTAAKLATAIQADPSNPLKVNAELLLQISEAIPDSHLKRKLAYYSTALGSTTDLSYRQVYWDISEALKLNKNAAIVSNFDETATKLDVLFNHSKLVGNALKGDFSKINSSTFLSSPYFMQAAVKATGSTAKAADLAHGLGLLAEAIVEEQQKKKEYKEQYKQLAQMSSLMVYAEMDEWLERALIDAYVGQVDGRLMYFLSRPGYLVPDLVENLNPLFRYEYEDGSSLYVEDKILKWRDASGKLVKNLLPAEPRNDGVITGSVKISTGQIFPKLKNLRSRIYVTDSLITFWNESDYECPDCLKKGYSYQLNPTTGNIAESEILSGGKYQSSIHQKYKELAIDKNKLKINEEVLTSVNQQKVYYYPHTKSDGKFRIVLLSGFTRKNESAIDINHVLYIENTETKVANSNYLRNKIAAIHTDYNNQLLFAVGANGATAKIHLNTFSDPDKVCEEIEKQLEIPGLAAAYDFQESFTPKPFYATGKAQEKFVQVLKSPDNKWLAYIAKDNLSLVSANDPTKAKTFKLTFKPSGAFFARENNSYTIHLQGYNEFNFPIAKKYSVNRLVEQILATK